MFLSPHLPTLHEAERGTLTHLFHTSDSSSVVLGPGPAEQGQQEDQTCDKGIGTEADISNSKAKTRLRKVMKGVMEEKTIKIAALD